MEKVENKEPDKCKELKWINLSDLPENIIQGIKNEIECIKNNIYYSSDNV